MNLSEIGAKCERTGSFFVEHDCHVLVDLGLDVAVVSVVSLLFDRLQVTVETPTVRRCAQCAALWRGSRTIRRCRWSI